MRTERNVAPRHQRPRQVPRPARLDLHPAREARQQPAHLGHRPLGQETPAVDQHDLLGQVLDLVQDVGGEQHVHPRLPQLAQEVQDLSPPQGVEPVERLVQHQQLGVVGEWTGRCARAWAHALGVALGAPAHGLAHLDPRQGVLGPLAALGAAEALQAQQEGHEVQAAHGLVDRVLLGAEAQPPEQPPVREGLLAQHAHLAAGGLDLAHDELEEGGLAGPVGADQPGHARPDPQRDLVQPHHLPVVAAQLARLEHRRHATTSSLRRRAAMMSRHRATAPASIRTAVVSLKPRWRQSSTWKIQLRSLRMSRIRLRAS